MLEFATAPTSAPTVDGSSGRILLVHDEVRSRATLAEILENNRYVVHQAAGRREAIELVHTIPLDAILLNLLLPEDEELTLLRELRELKTATELPIIMVTDNDDHPQIVEAFRCGANDYVTQPIDTGISLARIDTQLQLRRATLACQESEERYALAARGTNDGLWDWDLVTNHVYYSHRWKSMLGIEPASQRDSPDAWLHRIHSEDREQIESELRDHLSGTTPHFEVEMRLRHEDGTYRWMLCRGIAVFDDAGVAKRMAGSLTDITEVKVADALTGLPNRIRFLDRLRRCVDQHARDEERTFAVIYLDLDNFKLVNDSLGHEAGDQLLISVARRLEGSVRSGEAVIARLGGDEFTILIEQLEDREIAVRVAQRILDALSAPFALGCGREVFASASIGISYPSASCTQAEDMLREADTAMYEAKNLGRSFFQIFDPSMQQKVSTRLELESQLRRALERQEFVLHYQSIVELASSEVVGVEALIRWMHPDRGLVSPGEFIEACEETGLILPIGLWVIEEACTEIASLNAKLEKPLRLSVNVSGQQFSAPDLAASISQILDRTQFRPSNLNVEITESAIMQNPVAGAKQLEHLREQGVTIGIDDFGTGYSSLSSLPQLPLDLLKIDRSFIMRMLHSPQNRAIVRTILTLARGMNLDVVAEGIENDQQRTRLIDMGCRCGQGFFFSRPLPLEQVRDLVVSGLPTV